MQAEQQIGLKELEKDAKLNGGNTALRDYHMQLMQAEQQIGLKELEKDAKLNGGNTALTDYPMQLMLLEQLEEKRLLMARLEQDV